MMRPIESSDLRVDGIVETCINIAEINRAREFYQLLFNFEIMVSDERFCALRAGPDVLLLFTKGGSVVTPVDHPVVHLTSCVVTRIVWLDQSSEQVGPKRCNRRFVQHRYLDPRKHDLFRTAV